MGKEKKVKKIEGKEMNRRNLGVCLVFVFCTFFILSAHTTPTETDSLSLIQNGEKIKCPNCKDLCFVKEEDSKLSSTLRSIIKESNLRKKKRKQKKKKKNKK